MTRERPEPGTTVRYKTGGRTYVGMAHATPAQHGDDSFPVQNLAPPYDYIMARPGDPRILADEDDTEPGDVTDPGQ